MLRLSSPCLLIQCNTIDSRTPRDFLFLPVLDRKLRQMGHLPSVLCTYQVLHLLIPTMYGVKIAGGHTVYLKCFVRSVVKLHRLRTQRGERPLQLILIRLILFLCLMPAYPVRGQQERSSEARCNLNELGVSSVESDANGTLLHKGTTTQTSFAAHCDITPGRTILHFVHLFYFIVYSPHDSPPQAKRSPVYAVSGEGALEKALV